MIASVKLRYFDAHVRVGLAADVAGVDLRGADAKRAFDLAAPIHAWLDAREPGVSLRSLSIETRTGRVLVTIADPARRPRVVRVDPPASGEILDLAAPLFAYLEERAAAKIAARGAG